MILKEFYVDKRSAYFDDYARRYTDLPPLVLLKEHTMASGETVLVPDRYVRASDFNGKLGQANNSEEDSRIRPGRQRWSFPNGPSASAGAGRPRRSGPVESRIKEARHGNDVKLQAVGAGRRN